VHREQAALGAAYLDLGMRWARPLIYMFSSARLRYMWKRRTGRKQRRLVLSVILSAGLPSMVSSSYEPKTVVQGLLLLRVSLIIVSCI
jgi:hypothetical protein